MNLLGFPFQVVIDGICAKKTKLLLQNGQQLCIAVSEIGDGLLTFRTMETVSSESKEPIKSLLAFMH